MHANRKRPRVVLSWGSPPPVVSPALSATPPEPPKPPELPSKPEPSPYPPAPSGSWIHAISESLKKTNSTDIDADKELALLREKYLQLMKRYTPELEKKCKERSSEMSAYLLSLDKSISDPLARAEAKREIDEMKSVDILCRLHSAAFFCKSLYESFVRQRTTSSFLLSLQHSDMDNFNNLLDFYDTHCQPPK